MTTRKSLSPLVTYPLLALALAGCKSFSRSTPEVGDSLLAYVPESGQEDINRARKRCSEIAEQRSAAERDIAEVSSQRSLAEQNVDRLEARVAEATGQSKHARSYGTTDDLEKATESRTDTEAAYRLGEAKLAYAEVLGDLAERRKDLVDARETLAEARFELAKARAVSNLDRPIAEEIDVDEHRHAVMRSADGVERARIEALVARERAELWEKFVAERTENVPESMRLGEVAPMGSLFKADVYAKDQDQLERDELAPANEKSAKKRDTDK